MDTRVAVISIIVEQEDAIEELNTLLHEARQYIVGRMGIPDRTTGCRGIQILVLPLMHRRMSSVHFPEKLGV